MTRIRALVAATAVAVASAVIIDLSADLQRFSNINNSSGAIAFVDAAKADTKIRSALVLQDGLIVAEYSKPLYDNNKDVKQTWSTTKSLTSMLIGILVDWNLLDIDETLGDVWRPSSDVWDNVRDAARRQQVTIRSILSMTSGFEAPNKLIAENPLPGGNGGGKSLSDSLQYPDFGQSGFINFTYLPLSNILSYVIEERSGLSPKELASQTIFPALGMMRSGTKEREIEWWKNKDGMEYGYHGLKLTAVEMAKFGQLLLQNGQASPANDSQVVSSDWIAAATSPQTVPLLNTVDRSFYGFLFWVWDEFYCALGYGGNDICVHPELQRVSVQQRNPLIDPDGNLILADIAMQKYLSFGNTSAT